MTCISRDPENLKSHIRDLYGEAIMQWIHLLED
jgi:hypothetical protein